MKIIVTNNVHWYIDKIVRGSLTLMYLYVLMCIQQVDNHSNNVYPGYVNSMGKVTMSEIDA